MAVIDAVGAFLLAAVVLAGFTAAINPNSQLGRIMVNFGEAVSNVIKTAKG